jgi:2Fe-2S ferredoxin
VLTLRVETRSGDDVVVPAAAGASIMEIIRDGGIDEMAASCAGCCSCATCHIHVDPGDVDRIAPMSNDEDCLLDLSMHRDATSRLACQIRFGPECDGLRVRIAEEE